MRRPPAIALALITVLAAAGVSAPASAADPKLPPLPPNAIEVNHSELEFEMSTMVGSNTGSSGSLTVQECLVKLGDKVKAGQVLGRLNDRDLRAKLALLQETANSDIDVRVSQSRTKEATLSLQRLENLRKRSKSYTSDDEYGQVRLEAETAGLLAEQAIHHQEIAKLECLEVQAQIANRGIVSPHDGTVVEIFKKVGEAVTANEPMFEIVNTDIMRVTGYLNLEVYGLVKPGQDVQVYPETDELNPDKKKIEASLGKVIFVDRRVDPKTRTCKVVAQLTGVGPDIPSGIEAKMIILPDTLEAKADPAPDVPAAAAVAVPAPAPVAGTKPSTGRTVPVPAASAPTTAGESTQVAKPARGVR